MDNNGITDYNDNNGAISNDAENDTEQTESPAIVIVVQPQNVTTIGGELVEFSVIAEGDDLSYQWQEREAGSEWQDSIESGAGTPTLVITASQGNNGRMYQCIIGNGDVSAISNTAVLTVTSDIIITENPQSETVVAGQNTRLSVSAKGIIHNYQWQEKSVVSDEWINVQGTNGRILTIVASETLNGSQYRCIISNTFMTSVTSETATITVTSIPEIIMNPRDVLAEDQSDVRFFISAKGTDLSYQWKMKPLGSSTWGNITQAGANTNSITIKADLANNGAQYCCVVRNENGEATSDPATLHVLSKLFYIANDVDGSFANILPEGTYTFSLNANTNGVVFSIGLGIDGDTQWLCVDNTENFSFYSDGERPIRISIRATSGCKFYPMLEAGDRAHTWISPIERDHDVANDFNYDWFSIGNCFESSENIIVATLPCEITIRYRPIWKDTL